MCHEWCKMDASRSGRVGAIRHPRARIGGQCSSSGTSSQGRPHGFAIPSGCRARWPAAGYPAALDRSARRRCEPLTVGRASSVRDGPRHGTRTCLHAGTCLEHSDNSITPWFRLDPLSFRPEQTGPGAASQGHCVTRHAIPALPPRAGQKERGAPAGRARLVSIRHAQQLPSSQANLLTGNNRRDATNFWMFSEAGLRRILQRSGWDIVDFMTVGNTKDSDPATAPGDERAFCYVRSRYV